MADRLPAPAGRDLRRGGALSFRFDGRPHRGIDGDTIASALLADGVDVLSRSFKYHRPRGVLCAAGRCPNCLVEVDGEPNVRTCVTPLRPGMTVRRQNAWPSLRLDLLSLTDRFDRFFPVGFYYKTFIRPRRSGRCTRWSCAGSPASAGSTSPPGRTCTRASGTSCRRGGHRRRAGGLPRGARGGGGGRRCRAHRRRDEPRRAPADAHADRSGDARIAGLSGPDAADRLAELVAAEPRIEHLAARPRSASTTTG